MLTLTLSEYGSLVDKKIGVCLFCSSMMTKCGSPCEECGKDMIIPLEQALAQDKMILVEE